MHSHLKFLFSVLLLSQDRHSSSLEPTQVLHPLKHPVDNIAIFRVDFCELCFFNLQYLFAYACKSPTYLNLRTHQDIGKDHFSGNGYWSIQCMHSYQNLNTSCIVYDNLYIKRVLSSVSFKKKLTLTFFGAWFEEFPFRTSASPRVSCDHRDHRGVALQTVVLGRTVTGFTRFMTDYWYGFGEWVNYLKL
jgi:hypothetical protein